MVEISASVLGLKETNAIKQLYDLEVSGIDYFHIDVRMAICKKQYCHE